MLDQEYEISSSKQDFIRSCTKVKNDQLKELYENGGGEIVVSAKINENNLNSKIENCLLLPKAIRLHNHKL